MCCASLTRVCDQLLMVFPNHWQSFVSRIRQLGKNLLAMAKSFVLWMKNSTIFQEKKKKSNFGSHWENTKTAQKSRQAWSGATSFLHTKIKLFSHLIWLLHDSWNNKRTISHWLHEKNISLTCWPSSEIFAFQEPHHQQNHTLVSSFTPTTIIMGRSQGLRLDMTEFFPCHKFSCNDQWEQFDNSFFDQETVPLWAWKNVCLCDMDWTHFCLLLQNAASLPMEQLTSKMMNRSVKTAQCFKVFQAFLKTTALFTFTKMQFRSRHWTCWDRTS